MISRYAARHGGKTHRNSPFHPEHTINPGHRLALAFAASVADELEREKPYRLRRRRAKDPVPPVLKRNDLDLSVPYLRERQAANVRTIHDLSKYETGFQRGFIAA